MLFCENGISTEADSAELADISRKTVSLLTSPVWTKDGVLYVYELFDKDNCGRLNCSFLQEDLTVHDEKNDWITTILFALGKEGEDYDIDLDSDLLDSLDDKNIRGIEEIGEVEGDDVEKIISDSEGALRHFSFGKEHLSQAKLGNQLTVTDEAEGKIRRKIYDQDKKLIKYEEYASFSTSDKAVKTISREYKYDPESGILKSTVQENFDELTNTECDYDEKRHLVRKQVFRVEDEKQQPESDVRFEYDENHNVTLEDGKYWFYSKGRNDSVITRKSYIKKVYKYSDKSSNPDYEYYENFKLRMSTVYESENVYNETMYFNDGFSVELRYEDGIKVEERILLNGVEQRRTRFEK